MGCLDCIDRRYFRYFHYEKPGTGSGKELARINRTISEDIKTIHILKAEWSHLNNPERLRNLAGRHSDLSPVKAEQIISYASLPFDYEPSRKMLARKNLNDMAVKNKELRRLAKAQR